MSYGHWDTSLVSEFDTTEYFGFVYLVTNVLSGKKYVGKKSLWSTLTKKVNRVDGNGKKNTKVTKESDWRTYTTSSKEVNAELAAGVAFTFQILSLHKNKGALAYAEIECMVLRDVLRAKFDNGLREYYNGCIGNMKFALTDEISASHRKNLAKSMTGNSNAKGGKQTGTVVKHTQQSKDKISQSQRARHAKNKETK